MKFKKEHRQIMAMAFENYNCLVKMEQDDYLQKLFTVMARTDLKTFNRGESDFRDFAIRGYLHNLKNLHDEWLDILNAVTATRDIIDSFDNDETELA